MKTIRFACAVGGVLAAFLSGSAANAQTYNVDVSGVGGTYGNTTYCSSTMTCPPGFSFKAIYEGVLLQTQNANGQWNFKTTLAGGPLTCQYTVNVIAGANGACFRLSVSVSPSTCIQSATQPTLSGGCDDGKLFVD